MGFFLAMEPEIVGFRAWAKIYGETIKDIYLEANKDQLTAANLARLSGKTGPSPKRSASITTDVSTWESETPVTPPDSPRLGCFSSFGKRKGNKANTSSGDLVPAGIVGATAKLPVGGFGGSLKPFRLPRTAHHDIFARAPGPSVMAAMKRELKFFFSECGGSWLGDANVAPLEIPAARIAAIR